MSVEGKLIPTSEIYEPTHASLTNHNLERDVLALVLLLLWYCNCCLILLIIIVILIQRTPLHIAAREGYRYTVEHLVKNGADISIKDNSGVSV